MVKLGVVKFVTKYKWIDRQIERGTKAREREIERQMSGRERERHGSTKSSKICY